jgi:hypothetical protein
MGSPFRQEERSDYRWSPLSSGDFLTASQSQSCYRTGLFSWLPYIATLLPTRVSLLLPVYLLRLSHDLDAVEACLPRHCLATAVPSGSTIPALSPHVTLFPL